MGEEFNITIPSNPSTGFEWWTEFDPQFLTLVGARSTQDNVSLEMVGVPENEIFTYRAVIPGETEVYLLLLQPWENGTIAERLIYPVNIAE
jgi:inhibitor of cysteine peptidase